MVNLIVSTEVETDPQGQAIDKQAEEVEKSECRLVMRRIGVQNLPRLERVQTSDWWQITKKIKKSFTAVARQTMATTIDGAADGYNVN